MTANEAFEYALKEIDELRFEKSVSVKITPYDFTTDHGKEMLEKYSPKNISPENASPKKWCKIKFVTPNDEQISEIRELGNYLNLCGISFDSGGCAEGRDWELDWSFNYVAKDNQEAREARDQLEDIMKDCDI
jgi:hypothetical protein